MATFVALLRSINVGGTGKLPMADLRKLGERCGFTSVKTYIASGNVVLDATVPDILRLDQRRGDPSGLLLLDIDHFKTLNDQHGHLVGDEALRHVAKLLQQTLRQHDCVIRYGGEEFLLLLPGAGASAARALAEQVLAQLAGQPLPLPDGRTLTLGATIGVAVSPADGRTWQALLARADERMYAGKRSGRGRVVVA